MRQKKAPRKVIEREGKYYTVRGSELTRASHTLTESEFFGKIISAIRKVTMFWKPKNDYMESVRRPSQSSDKRLKYEYPCMHCKKWFKRTEVEADHIVPMGPFRKFEDAPGYLARAFVEKEGYQSLCKACHLEKTNERYL